MRALASSILCVLVLKASCRGFNETDLKYLQNLWLNAIKKTTNEHLFRQSLHGDDFQQLIDVLSRLETSESRWGLMQDIKTVILQKAMRKLSATKSESLQTIADRVTWRDRVTKPCVAGSTVLMSVVKLMTVAEITSYRNLTTRSIRISRRSSSISPA